MKTYVLTVSEKFPKTHSRAGQETNFVSAIKSGIKIHTIRGNYDLWKKRFDNIYACNAYLSIRTWSGVPYKTPQIERLKLYPIQTKIGIQKLQFTPLGWFIDDVESDICLKIIAGNDGLSYSDFKEWFKGNDFSKPMAIIHFTETRY